MKEHNTEKEIEKKINKAKTHTSVPERINKSKERIMGGMNNE